MNIQALLDVIASAEMLMTQVRSVILMVWYKTLLTPMCWKFSYHSLTLGYQYVQIWEFEDLHLSTGVYTVLEFYSICTTIHVSIFRSKKLSSQFRYPKLLTLHLMAGIILGMGSANGRRRYIVTPPLIGWIHTQNDPWMVVWVLFEPCQPCLYLFHWLEWCSVN